MLALPLRGLLLALIAPWAAAQSPSVGPVSVETGDDGTATANVTVRWPNSWRNDRNHDGVWLVLRSSNPHAGITRLAALGHRANSESTSVEAELTVGEDRRGLFIAPASQHRGDVEWHLRLRLADPEPADLTAWAVGMVYIPPGAFEVGDDDPLAARYGAFHRLDESKQRHVVRIESEKALSVSPQTLWYELSGKRYPGDQRGPIPREFPKGTRAFWVMKHELTQGFYARFLNALPRNWQPRRAPMNLEGGEAETCSIRREGDRFVASAPDRPCNFVTWNDTAALFDWLALRPMTELEFEKASRGPKRPEPRDFPWGTASDAGLERTVTKDRDLEFATVAEERELSRVNQERFGASFYWVMDLSGSLWERCISVGRPAGRAFRGTHGDGVLNGGFATNEDWPKTNPDGQHAPGIGYRGGAEYFGPRVADNPTNPHSPVAFRTFAGWGGAYRYKTYSARGCRTAPGLVDVLPPQWLGTWKGTMQIHGSRTSEVDVTFEVDQIPGQRRLIWRMTYGEPPSQVVKDYTLLPDGNDLMVDEGGGLMLNLRKVGNVLYSSFVVGGSYLTARYELLGDELLFEVTSARAEGESKGQVQRHRVQNVQTVRFRRQD